MKSTPWLLLGTLIIGLSLHLYRFGQIPVALNRDEAALGYNAYAIATTGTDEWGNRLPITFKSFGDYKLGGYIYILALLVRMFGVHDWVIRLPSLLASFGIVALTYILVAQLTHRRISGLAAASLVALQPWEIFYGRMAFEAHVALCLFLLSWYCWLHKRVWVNLVGLGTYALAITTYNTPLLLLPVIIVAIFTLPRHYFHRRWLVAVGLVLIGGWGIWTLHAVTAQKQAITILSDPTVIDAQAKAYTISHTVWQKMWNYKEVYWVRLALSRLVQSWSPAFLTIRGGQNPWHSVPGGAHLYWVTYILWLAGAVWLLVKKKIHLREKISYGWILIGSLLPAIITIDAPHATRSLWFFWLATTTAGIVWSYLSQKLQWVVAVVLVMESCLFGWRYFVQFPAYRSTAWPVGLREALLQTKGKTVAIDAHDADVVTDQVYIYPLLYWQVPPQLFVSTVREAPPDIVHMNRVLGFENFSTSRYNASASAIIERHADGSYALEP